MKQNFKVSALLICIVLLCTGIVGCQDKKETAKTAESYTTDTSWYNEKKSEFVLKTAGQLYGFAQLSKEHSFEGKTVKLGADIQLNPMDERTLENWMKGSAIAQYRWEPIGTQDLPFQGVFDGQGYTIRGLYLKTDSETVGLFGVVASPAEIGDFRLVDSYMKTSKGRIGIIGQAVGVKVEKIYTNVAIYAEASHVGGILGHYIGGYKDISEGKEAGWTKDAILIDTCWFDGNITTGKSSMAIGGIVGGQQDRAKVTISNCMFTGNITAANPNNTVRIGGIFGWPNWTASYVIHNCLSTGTIQLTAISDSTNAFVGGLLGDLGANGLNMKYCYTTYNVAIGRNQVNYVVAATCLKTEESLKGLDMKKLFPKMEGETECAWMYGSDGLPVLKYLAQ